MCHPNRRKKINNTRLYRKLLSVAFLKRSRFIITYYDEVIGEIFSKLTIKIYKDL